MASSGSVSSYAAKRGAEHAAQRVAGVKAVAGEMTVSIVALRSWANLERSAARRL